MIKSDWSVVMSENPNLLSCEEFHRRIPELLGAGLDPTNHPHAKVCDDCRGLSEDLRRISEAARKMFPDEGP
jgi:hypothetical protein